MKVTKMTIGNATIGGITFYEGVTVEVTAEVGNYIKKTFGDTFKVEGGDPKSTKKNTKEDKTDKEGVVDRETKGKVNRPPSKRSKKK